MISYFENSFMASASRHEDVPEMTDLQKRAIKAVEELADSAELRMDYVLQAGDIQLLHNHSIVHARTAFVDHDDVSALAILHVSIGTWADRFNAWLIIKLMAKGVVFSFLFFSKHRCTSCMLDLYDASCGCRPHTL